MPFSEGPSGGLRYVAYGYRYGEVPLPHVTEVKEGTQIKVRTMPVESLRPPVAVSLGCHAIDAALPHVDHTDVPTSIAGVQKRFATKPPPAVKAKMERFRLFVRKWVRKNLTPLSPQSDTTVESWLETCNYPASRKKELLEKYKEITDIRDPKKKYLACKSFIKDETYPAYKHARSINSRTDEFKTVVGPIFRLIEKELFKYEAFIKKIPIAERPEYIRNLLHVEGSKYFAADYTAFESLFVKELMESCEFELYDYMTQELPEGKWWTDLLREALTGLNECQFKDFVVKVICTRMSGEMNTSLGNGFTNLMVLLFLAEENGCKNIKVVVEGDDSAARMTGARPTAEDFKSLGLNCKVEFHDSIETMSFCGLVFDSDDLVNVTDPREVLASFGWSSAFYVRANEKTLKKLLRCKALSMAHQYPGCPIISALAQYGLRVTRSYDLRHFITEQGKFSQWERDQLISALKDEKKIKVIEPPQNTRLLVERLYGVTVEQQLSIEAFLNSLTNLQPFRMGDFVFNIPQDWEKYSHEYCRVVNVRHKESDHPSGFVGGIRKFMSNVNSVPERTRLSDSRLRR